MSVPHLIRIVEDAIAKAPPKVVRLPKDVFDAVWASERHHFCHKDHPGSLMWRDVVLLPEDDPLSLGPGEWRPDPGKPGREIFWRLSSYPEFRETCLVRDLP